MAKTLMAVDAGTGSVRAVLFSLESEQLGCVQQEWTHKEDPRYPGSMDFDWVHNWDLARGCIRGVIEQTGVDPHDIAAVSTTCMREGIVLYDKDGQEIWACANVDARSDDEVAQLRNLKSRFTASPARPTRWALCPACSGSKTKCRKSTKRPPCAPCSTTGSSIR